MFKKLLKKAYQTVPDVPEKSSKEDIKLKDSNIGNNLEQTLDIFKKIYTYPHNQDFKVRNLHIGGSNKKAAILFINTVTDTKIIEENVIKPLLSNNDSDKKIDDIVSVLSISTECKIKNVLTNLNKGSAILLVDDDSKAYILSAANFEGRNIEKSENETVVKGPKEAFNERANTNISMVRKKVKNENLVVESLTITERSKNDLFILYEKDLANDKLISNIKKRINALDVDAIQNLGLLEQHIEERKLSIFPTVLYTERPDRAASFIEDGYIVLLMDNSPACLVLPATFWSFYHSSEDHYLRFPYGNFTRILRMVALFITLFTSAVYVGVVSYHSEMIPPDLLLAIAATREKVPFPAAIEVIIMELAFELIREAGLRVPSPIGPTIGIVGALILGQAAVQANIVSPIVVIVVALGGLSSFAVGDISMNFSIRLIRFLFLIAASLFGIYGMAALFTAGIFYLVSIKSFGIPYLAPLTPKYVSSGDTIFRRVLQNEMFRPGYVKPKDIKKK
ncbi:spore germination protein KA [Oceanobacillus limi]|uniref:Spore germination protein KA n=1 Tax=Oceanobacillus limi TaxID=930131 RepID=A0A1I0D988_9BACI|nr:spore germination protein [Oceanobacillus limi]SET28099.1 spore germination protein KA [Oceanobacillus limi]